MENNDYILDFLFENKERCFFEGSSAYESICQEACALANQSGGCIVVGINDQRRIIGVTDEEISLINTSLLHKVRPSLPFTYSQIQRDGKQVLVVSIWEGANKPYACNGRFYVPMEGRVSVMDASQMQTMFQQKERISSSWERNLVNDASVDDLNANVVDLFRKSLSKEEKLDSNASAIDVLKKLGFVRRETFTNAAIVVVGNQPSAFFSQTRIRLSVYGEHDVLENVHLIDSSLVEVVSKLTELVLSYYPTTMRIENLRRQEEEIIPKIALREGILNAIVHREYDDYRSFVKVNIYSDRLEIINSGQLMSGLSIEDLSKRHSSLLRNPDIANAFFVLRYIEMAGSGTLRMIEECKKNHIKSPVWQEKDGCVILTFYARRLIGFNKTDTLKLVDNLTVDECVRKSLKEIVEYVQANPNAKSKAIADVVGKSYATVKRYVVLLKDAGLIEYKGSLKTGGWFLVSQ